MKRVLYILRYYPTLSETFVYREIVELQTRGVHVEVLSLGSRSDGELQDQLPDLPVHRLQRGFSGLLSRAFRRVSGARPVGDWARSRLGSKDQARIEVFAKTLIGRRFDRIHAHFAGEGAEWARALSEMWGIPYSVTVHANDLFCPRISLVDLLEKAEPLICIAERHQQLIKSSFGLESKLVRSGVPKAFYATMPKRSETELHVLSVGRWVEKKGLDTLVEAMVGLNQKARLTLVSDVPDGACGPEVSTGFRPPSEMSSAWLARIPHREHIQKRLEQLWQNERYGVPRKVAGKYYYSYNDGQSNQPTLYQTDDWSKDGQAILDVNSLSADGTVSLSSYQISDDGNYLAFGLSDGGSDWVTIRVKDLNTGEDLEDTIKWVKFSRASWLPDSSGFFYARYPEPTDDQETALGFQKVYFHKLGTPQSDDKLIYENPDEPKWGFGVQVTDDDKYLMMSIWEGTGESNRVYYREIKDMDGDFVKFQDVADADYSVLGHVDGRFIVMTDLDAPRRRIVSMNVNDASDIVEVVAETKNALQTASLVGGKLVLNYLVDAKTEVLIQDLTTSEQTSIELPSVGSAGGFGGKQTETEVFYWFTSPVHPTQIYRYDLATQEASLFRKPSLSLDSTDYVVRQEFVTSKDGTKVPLLISHRKDVEWNGETPTLLYGYGGFNISLTPFFSIEKLVWMEMGGIYATANLRGGGEYGREWHEGGTLTNKQNVFDDFIASAEWLIENNATSAKNLGIYGRSNGGLLAAATVLQRPDLFGAAIPAVGVLDMLRYHKFTIGWAWADDYGTSDDPEMFKYLLGYSPLHNTKEDTDYPPILVATADHDDRVVPAHSYKFTAALQAAQRGIANPSRPSLIRIETRSGHGAGKSVEAKIAETVDMWGFLAGTLGVPEAAAEALNPAAPESTE